MTTEKEKKVTCRVCEGYGYTGHTNPEIGIKCWNCVGTGLVPVDEPVEEEDPYTNDAWYQHHNLISKYTKEVDVGSTKNLSVVALAHERGVELSIGTAIETNRFGREMSWTSTGKRNVATMRELAKAINDACDFVEENNPKWASHGEIKIEKMQ